MKSKFYAALLALSVACGATVTASGQQQNSVTQDLIDGIVQDVVGRTIAAAEETIRRNTGIDPVQGGYNRNRNHAPLPTGASDESRRELRKLRKEHDRKIAKLERELQQKLDKAQAEFEREAAKEDKPEKVEKKRDKLEEKANKAYEKFEDKVAEENERFDEKRDQIVSKARK